MQFHYLPSVLLDIFLWFSLVNNTFFFLIFNLITSLLVSSRFFALILVKWLKISLKVSSKHIRIKNVLTNMYLTWKLEINFEVRMKILGKNFLLLTCTAHYFLSMKIFFSFILSILYTDFNFSSEWKMLTFQRFFHIQQQREIWGAKYGP